MLRSKKIGEPIGKYFEEVLEMLDATEKSMSESTQVIKNLKQAVREKAAKLNDLPDGYDLYDHVDMSRCDHVFYGYKSLLSNLEEITELVKSQKEDTECFINKH